jgi:ABC-type transport system substrate-binding protein
MASRQRRVDTPMVESQAACLSADRGVAWRCALRNPLLSVTLGCLVLSSLGCPKAEEHTEAASATVPSRAWLEGELPPSVHEGLPVKGGSLTVRITSDPPSLNPNTTEDLWADRLIVGSVEEALVRVDEKDAPRYRVVPALAESWEVSPDGRVYTFKLRHGVRFHDGTPLTAHDVVATIDRIMDERVRAMQMRIYFANLDRADKTLDGKGYKALDDFTVRIAYQKPYFMTLTSLADVPVQPRHLLYVEGTTVSGSTANELKLQPGQAARFTPGAPLLVSSAGKKGQFESRNVVAVNDEGVTLDRALPIKPGAGTHVEVDLNNDPVMLRNPIGSGPWKFLRWLPSDRIEFVRNDDYWGEKPHLDRLVIRVVPNHTVATQLFERGEFDVMTEIQPAVWEEMQTTPRWVKDYNRVRYFWNNYSWIGWNERRPFFKERQVRQAMTYLFDRESFLKNALKNLEKPTTCPFFYQSPGCDPALLPYPYDPDKGRRLLDAAGWIDHDGDGIRDKDGVPFRFTFLMTENSVMLAKLTPVLKEALHKVGVEMDIAKVEWGVFMERLRDGDFDACSLLWGEKVPEIDPRQVWHSSQINGGSNYIAYRNREVDDLIDKLTTELDAEKRYVEMRRMHQILSDEQPYTWLYVRPRLEAISRRIKGLTPTVGFYDFSDAWVDPSWQAADGAVAGASSGAGPR